MQKYDHLKEINVLRFFFSWQIQIQIYLVSLRQKKIQTFWVDKTGQT